MADRPIRVALVTPYFPPSVGGLERYTHHEALALRDDPGFEVVVVTTGTSRRTSVTEEDGVTVVRLAPWLKLSNSPVSGWWPVQLRRLFARHRIDVVHAHAPTPGLPDLASYAAGRRPVVLTYHSGSMVKGVGGAVDALLRTYERQVLPRVMRRSSQLIAVSPVAVTHGTGRARLVPPGVDSTVFVPGPPVTGSDVLFVGRIQRTSRWKGVATLLSAFASLSHPEARLVLVGDGDDVPFLQEQAASLGIADRVVWRGPLHDAELVAAYQSAAVVVLPSLTESESFGMTLVEAMACGRPVVGSDVGGIPFVVRPGVDGELVPAGDAAALAATLDRLLGSPDVLARMGAAGREAAVERWDWTHSVAGTLDVLRDAAAARPS